MFILLIQLSDAFYILGVLILKAMFAFSINAGGKRYGLYFILS